jgi:hypothetical protein
LNNVRITWELESYFLVTLTSFATLPLEPPGLFGIAPKPAVGRANPNSRRWN